MTDRQRQAKPYSARMTWLLDRASVVASARAADDIEDAIDRVLMGWFVRWRRGDGDLEGGINDADGPLILEVLVLRHEQFVYEQAWRIVRRLGLMEEDAFDLTSEVFLALLEKPNNYSDRGGRFRGFLRTLTRNKAIDLFRKKKRRKTFSDHDATVDAGNGEDDGLTRTARHVDVDAESVEEALTRHDMLEVFLEAYNARLEVLEAQTPRQHEAWVHCVGHGLNSSEAATLLGSSPATIRRNKNLAAKSLRAWLESFCQSHELNPDELLAIFD